ncbi:hypothetical protein Pme01_24420 [Planosporangium mesophilum]|uniref:Uncharacterized protein n=1 Tax=Planosporangium mesophilum TaxID=689768 RepID=A0A8J3TK37_9ACTN|nr:hypothetical protein Pme01_24420 [Planosporangium mesophilum]
MSEARARAFREAPGEPVDGDEDVRGVGRVDAEAGDVPVPYGAVDGQRQLVPARTVDLADRDAATEARVVARAAPADVRHVTGDRDRGGRVARTEVEHLLPSPCRSGSRTPWC